MVLAFDYIGVVAVLICLQNLCNKTQVKKKTQELSDSFLFRVTECLSTLSVPRWYWLLSSESSWTNRKSLQLLLETSHCLHSLPASQQLQSLLCALAVLWRHLSNDFSFILVVLGFVGWLPCEGLGAEVFSTGFLSQHIEEMGLNKRLRHQSPLYQIKN